MSIELFAKLKAFLAEHKSEFVITEDWNGSTETGFYTTHDFDMEKLWAQIDAFAQEFAKPNAPLDGEDRLG